MKRFDSWWTGLLISLCLCAPVLAATPVPQPAPPMPQPGQAEMVDYRCADNHHLQVIYWSTANGQSFALVPIADAPLLFVETIAASGVKYQAGAYTWWAKGPQANLYDARNGTDAAPVMADCNGAS